MRLTVAQHAWPSVLFVIAAIVCALANLYSPGTTTPGIDILVGGAFRVIHLHPLAVGVLLCLFYAALYYLSALLLNLSVRITLASLHLLITILAVIGLRNLHYIGLRRGPIVINPVVTIIAGNALTLLMLSGLLLIANVLLASMVKWRQAH